MPVQVYIYQRLSLCKQGCSFTHTIFSLPLLFLAFPLLPRINRSGASSVSSPSSSGARESTISISTLTYHSSVIRTNNSIDRVSITMLSRFACLTILSISSSSNQSITYSEWEKKYLPPTSPYKEMKMKKKLISRTHATSPWSRYPIMSCIDYITLLLYSALHVTTTVQWLFIPPTHPGQSLLSEACSTDIIVRLIVNWKKRDG